MLKQKLNGLPTTLESTYDQILTRIEEADAMNAMKLLLWLTFSERPIHVEDLAIIAEFDVEKQQFDVDAKLHYPDDALKICSSLVTKMEDETVQFAHASIKEYFQSDKRNIGLFVTVDPCFGHYFVGQSSLAYILQRKQAIPECNSPASTRFLKSLLRYAAHFWPKHILTSNQESAVMNQIINLFESESLTYWVTAFNYQNDYDSVSMIYPNYLQIAALHGLIETAKWLMLQPVNSVECMEALSAAAYNGHINMVILLFEKGNIEVESGLYCQALERAARSGENQVVALLCEHGKDTDVFHKFTSVAIYEALKSEQKGVVKMLINCSGPKFKVNTAAVECAANVGDIELIQLMLEKESDEKKRKKLIVAIVEQAASGGHIDILDIFLTSEVGLTEPSAPLRELLHENKLSVVHRKKLHATALNSAAEYGLDGTVEYLLRSGADMKAIANAVVIASQYGHVETVELLLDSGIDMNVYRRQISDALCAAAKGHKKLVEFLLEQGADPNLPGKDGQTPLHIASYRGCKNIVQILIDNGADVNHVQGGEYGYAIWAAMSQGHHGIIELLLQHGVSPSVHSEYDGEALEAACKGGYRNIVQLLLDEGVDVNARGTHVSALVSAVMKGHRDIVKLLLEKGVDINAFGGAKYQTALIAASHLASEDIVRLLLEWGADVNIVGGKWGTALQAASHKGEKNSVQLLLEWGANVNDIQPGTYYGSSLIAASHRGHRPIVEVLLEWGANVNIQAGDSDSALNAASYYCQKQIVELLLEWGADVNIQGKRHGSALYAAAQGHGTDKLEITQLLLAHGAKYLGPIVDDSYMNRYVAAESDSDSMESDNDESMESGSDLMESDNDE